MNDLPIIVAKVVAATPLQVWQALTDPAIMKQWYFDLPGFEARVGYQFQFEGGPDPNQPYIHLCQVTEAVPERLLSYSWRYKGYDGDTLVAFSIEAVDGVQTKVTLTHHGVHTFPESNPDLARKNFEAGWNHIITISLAGFFAQKN